MDINRALYEFGVRDDTLSDADVASLDRDGFLRIENALTQEQVATQKRRVDEIAESEGEEAGIEVHKEVGTDRLGEPARYILDVQGTTDFTPAGFDRHRVAEEY